MPWDATIIHGSCRGADQLAGIFAARHRIRQERYKADWKKHGKRAGPIRNTLMLDQKPDLVIAFTDDLQASRGTRDTVTKARNRGIPVEVIGHVAPQHKRT